jgi:hypothetical protein
MQQLTEVTQVTGVFEALLQGVRSCAPKCAECRHPLGDEQAQSHARALDNRLPERICHSCFMGEIAEAQVNQSPGLR